PRHLPESRPTVAAGAPGRPAERYDGPMPQRPKRIRREASHYSDGELWFHLTVHAHPALQSWPPSVADAIWRTVVIETSMPRVEIAAACLMPDHVHLLVRPKESGILQFLNAWKSISPRAAWGCGHRGGLWQPGMW